MFQKFFFYWDFYLKVICSCHFLIAILILFLLIESSDEITLSRMRTEDFLTSTRDYKALLLSSK